MNYLRALPVFLALTFVLGLAGCETLNRQDRALLEQHYVSGPVIDKMSHNERLELPDIIELSKHGVPDPFILNYLKSTYATYQLTTSDVLDLTKAGVSKLVTDYLMATPTLYGPPRYPYDYPGYNPYGPYPYYYNYPPPVIVADPYFHHHW